MGVRSLDLGVWETGFIGQVTIHHVANLRREVEESEDVLRHAVSMDASCRAVCRCVFRVWQSEGVRY